MSQFVIFLQTKYVLELYLRNLLTDIGIVGDVLMRSQNTEDL